MKIKIFYNDKEDEFSRDLCLEDRLKKYIEKSFYPAFVIAHLSDIYLLGGSIRDLIFAKEPQDLDFVVLGKENKEWVLQVLNKFNVNYEINRLGGYKFTYNGTKVDLWLSDDLFSSIEYNVDGLFYNLKNNSMLSVTFQDFMDNNLRKVNENNNIDKGRILKLEEFAKRYLN